MQNRSSRKSDINQLAASIVDAATGDIIKQAVADGKDPLAVLLGQRGGLKGGKARAISLSAEKRSEIAQKAAQTRWNKEKKDE